MTSSFPIALRDFFALLRDQYGWRAYYPVPGGSSLGRVGWVTIAVPEHQTPRLHGHLPPTTQQPWPRRCPAHALLTFQDDTHQYPSGSQEYRERTEAIGAVLAFEAQAQGFAVDWTGHAEQQILVCFPADLPQLQRFGQ